MEPKKKSTPIMTYDQQVAQGLIKPSGPRYVPAMTGEILPPVKPIPNAPVVTDPYAQHAPQIVQQVTNYEAGPITRAQALEVIKGQRTLAPSPENWTTYYSVNPHHSRYRHTI